MSTVYSEHYNAMYNASGGHISVSLSVFAVWAWCVLTGQCVSHWPVPSDQRLLQCSDPRPSGQWPDTVSHTWPRTPTVTLIHPSVHSLRTFSRTFWQNKAINLTEITINVCLSCINSAGRVPPTSECPQSDGLRGSSPGPPIILMNLFLFKFPQM